MIGTILDKSIDYVQAGVGAWLKQRLSNKEKEILRTMRDHKQIAHIFKIDTPSMPAFVKVGNILFHKDGETILAREYVEAARALAVKGYVEDIGNETFSLTAKGMKVRIS